MPINIYPKIAFMSLLHLALLPRVHPVPGNNKKGKRAGSGAPNPQAIQSIQYEDTTAEQEPKYICLSHMASPGTSNSPVASLVVFSEKKPKPPGPGGLVLRESVPSCYQQLLLPGKTKTRQLTEVMFPEGCRDDTNLKSLLFDHQHSTQNTSIIRQLWQVMSQAAMSQRTREHKNVQNYWRS